MQDDSVAHTDFNNDTMEGRNDLQEKVDKRHANPAELAEHAGDAVEEGAALENKLLGELMQVSGENQEIGRHLPNKHSAEHNGTESTCRTSCKSASSTFTGALLRFRPSSAPASAYARPARHYSARAAPSPFLLRARAQDAAHASDCLVIGLLMSLNKRNQKFILQIRLNQNTQRGQKSTTTSQTTATRARRSPFPLRPRRQSRTAPAHTAAACAVVSQPGWPLAIFA